MAPLNGASRTYNAANQMTHDSTNSLAYDDNGNLTDDGVNSYVWDRANRLLSMGGVSYAYNGDGNRIQQDALKYILDLQPDLTQVLGDSDGNRYIHSPRGIHASQSPTSTWSYIMQDGLGSVRSVADSSGSIVSTHNYTPVGVMDVPFEWAFTGEQRDYTGVQYHRARYYNPALGIFPSLDPFEGLVDRPMSLNGYAWVEGNVINATDASGQCMQNDVCQQLRQNGASVRQLLSFGCVNIEQQKCCGPDATEWLHSELRNHMFYSRSTFLSSYWDTKWIGGLIHELNLAQNLWRIAVYGLAVDYGAVDYPRVARSSLSDYSCDQTDYVSICGKCHHSTDMGNFVLGAVISAGGFVRNVAQIAGRGFNAGVQNDTTSVADSAGVLAGYDFVSSGYSATFSRENFCSALRNLGSGWHDRTRNRPGCDNGRACEACRGDLVLLPIHSIPDWNEYVSTVINGYNRYSGRSPQDELIQKAPGLIEWLINHLSEVAEGM